MGRILAELLTQGFTANPIEAFTAYGITESDNSGLTRTGPKVSCRAGPHAAQAALLFVPL